MRKLRDQGLSPNQLNIVFDAIILSRITYGVCAWSGFLSVELIGRIDAFFRRMFRYGFCKRIITFREVSDNCDNTLFNTMLNSHSCIHQLLPSLKNEIMQLRQRGHKFVLPNCTSNLYKVSFVNRCLFSYVWCAWRFYPWFYPWFCCNDCKRVCRLSIKAILFYSIYTSVYI